MPPRKGQPTIEEVAQKLPGYLPPGKRPVCRTCQTELKISLTGRAHRHGGTNVLYTCLTKEDAIMVRYGFEGCGVFCTKECGFRFGLCVARES
jgi:RNase P subunit RPR2